MTRAEFKKELEITLLSFNGKIIYETPKYIVYVCKGIFVKITMNMCKDKNGKRQIESTEMEAAKWVDKKILNYAEVASNMLSHPNEGELVTKGG